MSFSFNSQIEREPNKTRYSLQITTDNKEQFEFMEKIARECIDGKHKKETYKIKPVKTPRCNKCVWELHCLHDKDFENTCPDYSRDAPDGGFYG